MRELLPKGFVGSNPTHLTELMHTYQVVVEWLNTAVKTKVVSVFAPMVELIDTLELESSVK